MAASSNSPQQSAMEVRGPPLPLTDGWSSPLGSASGLPTSMPCHRRGRRMLGVCAPPPSGDGGAHACLMQPVSCAVLHKHVARLLSRTRAHGRLSLARVRAGWQSVHTAVLHSSAQPAEVSPSILHEQLEPDDRRTGRSAIHDCDRPNGMLSVAPSPSHMLGEPVASNVPV